MATLTTGHGRPYPDGTERVRDGDNAIGALATAGDLHDVAMSSASGAGVAISTATATDVPGCTFTFTTQRPNAKVLIIGVFDARCDTAGNTLICSAVADGTGIANGNFRLTQAATRVSICAIGVATLAAAGSHTIKLQGRLDAAGGTATIASNTVLSYVLQES